MDFFTAFDISATGLTAQRTRMNVISSNLANVHSTDSENGGPYRRKDVVVLSYRMDAPTFWEEHGRDIVKWSIIGLIPAALIALAGWLLGLV